MTIQDILAIIVPLGSLMLWLHSRIDKRMDKLDEKLTDVDRRLCRLEGAFSSKECCMIKDDRQLKKVE